MAPLRRLLVVVLVLGVWLPQPVVPAVSKKDHQTHMLDGCRDAPVWTACMRAHCDISEIDMDYKRPSLEAQTKQARDLIAGGRSVLTFGYKSNTLKTFDSILKAIRHEPGFRGAIIVCSGPAPQPNLEKYYADSKVLFIWTTHAGFDPHPKMRPIPLGFNFHTLMQQSYEGEKAVHWIDQWQELNRALSQDVKPHNSVYSCFRNTHPSRSEASRALATFPEGTVRRCRTNTPRHTFWQESRESMYVMSPRGSGPDAHRTWEALYLEVPVVLQRTGAIDTLFEDMPTYMVDSWSGLTFDKLTAALTTLQQRSFHRDRFASGYWLALIEDQQQAFLNGTLAFPT
ncbi:uncharacterized protein MONBRDRAFT_6960 [Monosiga brevicollis MX1]|uniref:Exostosin GT47 domain-containing protein n=1 Tax=Monosiga brevicollis TaxID=81824 RepID=A9UVH0_MONBE|nr:uncharacterized protein MONBRDRAFT_6960 [Monosiga brevicollis MX1]EDQ90398.1 predicted protein [Monosiga brevicollis MX1]|eukprot:XP_001744449.1 hypothetical protein [Monosiga brevicollis MX1]